MKLAHYLHIAPRTLFVAQGMATLVGAIVQCGVTVFMITRIHGVCTANAAGGFTCPHGEVTYSSSLIWGKCESALPAPCVPELTMARCAWSRSKLLSWPDLREFAMVLPRWTRRCDHHMAPRPAMEQGQLYFLACRIRRHEPCSTRDGH